MYRVVAPDRDRRKHTLVSSIHAQYQTSDATGYSAPKRVCTIATSPHERRLRPPVEGTDGNGHSAGVSDAIRAQTVTSDRRERHGEDGRAGKPTGGTLCRVQGSMPSSLGAAGAFLFLTRLYCRQRASRPRGVSDWPEWSRCVILRNCVAYKIHGLQSIFKSRSKVHVEPQTTAALFRVRRFPVPEC